MALKSTAVLRRRRLHVFHDEVVDTPREPEHGEPRGCRNRIFEQLHSLRHQLRSEMRQPCNAAAGCARLAIIPVSTGYRLDASTIGIDVVACFTAIAAGPAAETMRSGF